MRCDIRAALLGLALAGAASGEKLTVVFTPDDRSAVAQGTVVVLASPQSFRMAGAGLMTAYFGKMVSRGPVRLTAGQALDLDLDGIPPNFGHVGVMLDTNHNFMWRGMPDVGEYCSARVAQRTGSDFSLRLNQTCRTPERRTPEWMQEHAVGNQRMLVGLPPGYQEGEQRYPVVFVFHGFNGDRWAYLRRFESWRRWMARQPMILVSLDSFGDYGHHLFLDSPGNGPRLRQLREEVVPFIDRHFRTNGKRVLYGHSSGGWTVVSLLRRAPELFAGGTASAPDPLTLGEWWRGDADNLYRDQAGKERCFAPALGLSMRRFVDCERESDSYGQFTGFLAPFSPPLAGGGWQRFESPFDLESGALRPETWERWKENDLLHWAQTHPEEARRAFEGKLRLVVGDSDEFGLTETTRAFSAELNRMRIVHQYVEIAGAGHFELEAEEDSGGRLWSELFGLTEP